MKNFLLILMTIIFLTGNETALASNSYTCAFLKFSNESRYQNIGVAENFSDIILEKILTKTKIKLIEAEIKDKNLESMFYDEQFRNIVNAKNAINANNLSLIFEDETFNAASACAESISTAEVGQIIVPEITKKIGESFGVEYLIQGTILNLGNGIWDGDGDSISTAIGIQCDLKIIKATTGEVIWKKNFSGYGSETSTGGRHYYGMGVSNYVPAEIPKLESKIYSKLLEKASNEIIKALVEDFNARRLFIKWENYW